VGQDERRLLGSSFGAAATAYAEHRPELLELLPRHEGEVGSWTAQAGHAQALLDSLIQIARIRWEKRK
jgi:hypothetical protein